MNQGKYVFAQLTEFLPRRVFDGMVEKYQGNRYVKHFTCWNQLLAMIFGQLSNRDSLRDLIVSMDAHSQKSYHLGFGKIVTRSNLAKANESRDYRVFEELAYYLIDIATQIPAFVHITDAKVHDVRAMDLIPYESGAYYIFDRGYVDYDRLYRITLLGSYFVIRSKKGMQFECSEYRTVDVSTGVLSDQVGSLVGFKNSKQYPEKFRKVVFYDVEIDRTFVFNSWS